MITMITAELYDDDDGEGSERETEAKGISKDGNENVSHNNDEMIRIQIGKLNVHEKETKGWMKEKESLNFFMSHITLRSLSPCRSSVAPCCLYLSLCFVLFSSPDFKPTIMKIMPVPKGFILLAWPNEQGAFWWLIKEEDNIASHMHWSLYTIERSHKIYAK